MPDKVVQITYEAFVKGMDKVQDLSRENEKLSQQNDEYQQKLKKLSEEHERHNNALSRASAGIRAVRRELFAISFTIGAVVAGLKLLSFGSDALTERFEKLGTRLKDLAQPAGDFIAKLFGNKGQISTQSRVDILGLQADTARFQGDELTSLLKRQESERVKLLENATKERKRLIESELLARQDAERKAFELSELGLKNQMQIVRDFQRDVVQSAQGGTSDVLFKFMQGEHQSASDILKTFTTGFNRAVSDAFSQALFTSFAEGKGLGGFFQNFMNILKGKTPAVIAQEKTNEHLAKIEDTNARIAFCVCVAAERLDDLSRNSRPTSMTIEQPKKTGLEKAAAVFGAIGQIASLGAGVLSGGVPGVGGGSVDASPLGFMPPAGRAGPEFMPQLTMPSLPIGHSGGPIPHFDSGGEVTMKALPGEFMVRRSAAAANKGMLREINNGAKPVPGTTNVFMITANDAKSFADMLASPSARAQIEIQLIRSIMSNGNSRNIIKDFAR